MTKFNTRAEAKAAGAALFATGKVTAWTDYNHFGKFILRVQVGGKHWFNLTSAMAS